MKIVVTGGCGFIGTQVVDRLLVEGHDVTVVDRRVGNWHLPCRVVEMDYFDFFLSNNEKYDTVIHLAAEHLVGQSILNPGKYYDNNVVKMQVMLSRMVDLGIENIIFSSSGNIYGKQGLNGVLTEDLYYDPENPYASSKVAGELLIKDYARAYGLKYVIFRFFNAAGADPYGRFGYDVDSATHIIPSICKSIRNDIPLKVFGSDYPTKDGTCIRDYVHVSDIADAHTKALLFIDNGLQNEIFNLGGGSNGVSVIDIINYAGEIINRSPAIEYMPRRAGDPAQLIANISKAKALLGWWPKYNVRDAILHAWNWQ